MEDPRNSFGSLSVFLRCLEEQPDVNTTDDEHAVVFLDLARCIARQQAVAGRDLTRLQRASKGSDESTRS